MPARLAPRRWPWFSLAAALVAVLAVGWFFRPGAPPAAVPSGWSSFSPPDRSFDVLGPGRPSVRDVNSSIGPEHEVRFDAPPGQILGLEWVDVTSGTVVGTEGDLMAAWANSVVQDVGGVLDEQDVLRAGAHPGVGLHLESGGRSVYLRVFAADGRLYEIAAVLPVSASSHDLATSRRFVDSFRLLV